MIVRDLLHATGVVIKGAINATVQVWKPQGFIILGRRLHERPPMGSISNTRQAVTCSGMSASLAVSILSLGQESCRPMWPPNFELLPQPCCSFGAVPSHQHQRAWMRRGAGHMRPVAEYYRVPERRQPPSGRAKAAPLGPRLVMTPQHHRSWLDGERQVARLDCWHVRSLRAAGTT